MNCTVCKYYGCCAVWDDEKRQRKLFGHDPDEEVQVMFMVTENGAFCSVFQPDLFSKNNKEASHG